MDRCLYRTKSTLAQVKTKSVEERLANMSGAFVCADNSVTGKAVLLVDDVTTTGATLDSAAAALKRAGAAYVWGLTVAKEI